MSNTTDPNSALGGGFEEWACNDFNLLDYVGQDNSPLDHHYAHDDFEYNDEEDGLRKKDMIYSTWQINNVLLHDQTTDQFNDQPFSDPTLSSISMPISNSMTLNDNYMMQESSMVPSSSKSSLTTSPTILSQKPIKVEHSCDFGKSNFEGIFENVPREISTPQLNDSYASKMIKPRKYRIKPDSEKRNPHYRAKREKNNDAVRKSREKAKRMQEEKEDRLHFLEEEYVKQSKVIEQLRSRNHFLEEQLLSVKRTTCTCQQQQRQPQANRMSTMR